MFRRQQTFLKFPRPGGLLSARGHAGALLALLLLPLAAQAQQYDLKVYSVNEGLPQQQVAGISQDTLGYIWLGTYGEGLARFDGREFHQVTSEQGLRDDRIYELYHDSANRFWVSTESGGVARVEGDTAFYPFTASPLDTVIVNRVSEIDAGRLYLATYGAGMYILEDDSLRSVTSEEGLASDIVWDVHRTGPGRLWIATHSGITVAEDGRPVRTLEGTGGLSVYRIHRAAEGRYWLATNDGLRIWEEGTLSVRRSVSGEDLGYVYDIGEDRNGYLWLGTAANGLFRWDGTRFDHVSTDNGLSSNHIYELFRDRDGYLWAATDENGVNLLRSNAFLRYSGRSNPLLNGVHAIHRSADGILWVGTEAGLGRRIKGEFRQVGGTEIPGGVWDITGRPGGNLLLLLEDNTVLEYDRNGFTDLTAERNLGKVHTLDILADSRDRLWIAREDGLLRLDYLSGESRMFTTGDGLPSHTIWDMYEDSAGNLWLGTDEGLALLRGDSLTVFNTGDGLAHNRISHLTEGPEGALWLGTGEGISRVVFSDDFGSAEFLNLTGLHRTHRDETQLLAFDSDGYLWQGTGAGIHRINPDAFLSPDEKGIRHYRFDAPGEGIETMHKAVGSDPEGRLWIGTVDGMIMYDPSRALDEPVYPPVHVTAVETRPGVFGHMGPSVARVPSVSERQNLPHEEDDLVIHFNALGYLYPGQVNYSYRLEGFSDRWSPLSETRHAMFTNLPPGDYRFEVRALNSRGNWSAAPAAVDFHISAPFWQTWWFRSLAILGMIAGIYAFTRIRVSYLERNKLRELVDEKTRDLREALREKEVLVKEVHHRVKNNLAVISGLLQMQEWESEDPATRDVLKDSQMRIQSISLVHEKLYRSDNMAQVNFREYAGELLSAIASTYGHRRDQVELRTDIADIPLSVNLAIPTSLIMNELVTNAYKHGFREGGSGHISVCVETDGSHLKLEVRDSGAGLPDDFCEGSRNSLGMSLVSTLIRQLSGEMDSFNDGGAVFRITYPLKSDSGGARDRG